MNYDAVIIAGKEKKIMAASILEGVPWTKILEARLFVESAVQILYNSRPCVFVSGDVCCYKRPLTGIMLGTIRKGSTLCSLLHSLFSPVRQRRGSIHP